MLDGKKIEQFEDKLSKLFVIIAQSLIDHPLRFDYLSYVNSTIRKNRQIVFEGNIVSEEDYGEWNDRVEFFKAIVTDKRITKQGICIKIWVGDNFGEDNLLDFYE